MDLVLAWTSWQRSSYSRLIRVLVSSPSKLGTCPPNTRSPNLSPRFTATWDVSGRRGYTRARPADVSQAFTPTPQKFDACPVRCTGGPPGAVRLADHHLPVASVHGRCKCGQKNSVFSVFCPCPPHCGGGPLGAVVNLTLGSFKPTCTRPARSFQPISCRSGQWESRLVRPEFDFSSTLVRPCLTLTRWGC